MYLSPKLSTQRDFHSTLIELIWSHPNLVESHNNNNNKIRIWQISLVTSRIKLMKLKLIWNLQTRMRNLDCNKLKKPVPKLILHVLSRRVGQSALSKGNNNTILGSNIDRAIQKLSHTLDLNYQKLILEWCNIINPKSFYLLMFWMFLLSHLRPSSGMSLSLDFF